MATKFFQFVSPEINYDFVGFRSKFMTTSGIAIIASFVLIGVMGLNFGLDFRGGTEVQLEFVPCPKGTKKAKNCVHKDKVNAKTLRASLDKAFPGSKIVVQQTGNQGTGFLLKFGKISFLNQTDYKVIKKSVGDVFGKLLVSAKFRKEGGNKIDLIFSRKLVGAKKITPIKKAKAPTKGTKKAPSNAALQKRLQEMIKKLQQRNKNLKIVQPRKVAPRRPAAPAPRRTVAPAPRRAVAPAPRKPEARKPAAPAPKRAVAPAPAARRPAAPAPKRAAAPAPRKPEARKPAAPAPKRAAAPAPRTAPAARKPAARKPAARKPEARKAAAPPARTKPFMEMFAPAARRPAPAARKPAARKPASVVPKGQTAGSSKKTAPAGKEAKQSVRNINVASVKAVKNEIKRIRKLFEALGLGTIEISKASRQAGDKYEYSITFEGLGAKLRHKLEEIFGMGSFKILQVETVGPSVGDKLRADGITSIFLANLFILIYISIRFDFRYAPGAVAALLHDVFITMGVFAALQLPFDLAIVAALLTIIGYSLNDTIVVYDRIRENWQKSRVDFGQVMNRSINETLSRTLLTSITTFIAVVPIFIIGGENIKWFAFAMMFGILIGTYSSIAIASPIVYFLDGYFSRKQREEDKEAEDKRERRRRRRAGLTEKPSEA